MSNYWGVRVAKAQTALTDKSLKQVEAQLAKYYSTAMKRIIADFEAISYCWRGQDTYSRRLI